MTDVSIMCAHLLGVVPDEFHDDRNRNSSFVQQRDRSVTRAREGNSDLLHRDGDFVLSAALQASFLPPPFLPSLF